MTKLIKKYTHILNRLLTNKINTFIKIIGSLLTIFTRPINKYKSIKMNIIKNMFLGISLRCDYYNIDQFINGSSTNSKITKCQDAWVPLN